MIGQLFNFLEFQNAADLVKHYEVRSKEITSEKKTGKKHHHSIFV